MGWRLSRASALIVAVLTAGPIAASAQAVDDSDFVYRQIQQLEQAGKYADVLALNRKLSVEVEKAETARAGRPGAETARVQSSLSWYALLTHDFASALVAGNRAHDLLPDNLYIEINRAHALLLTGHRDEAQAIYVAHKGQPISLTDDTMWEDVIAGDIEGLRAAGVEDSAFSEILQTLGGKSPKGDADLGELRKRIQQLFDARNDTEALPLAETYLKRALERHGERHAEFASAIFWLAKVNELAARHAEAEAQFKRSLAIRETVLGRDQYSVAASLDNLARLYQAQGRYPEAEPLFKRALAIAEKALGADHLAVGIQLNNLAALYRDQGRYGETEPLHKRALAIREKTLGPDHPDVGQSLNNLALLYMVQGRYGEAEPLCKRALAIVEKALGADHPDVGVSLNNLAVLYQDQGRYGEAEPLHKRALAIAEKALGPDHPEVATRLNNLAVLYKAQGRYADAEPLYKRALAIREKALGPDHPDLGMSINNLASLYFSQGDWARAADNWRRSTSLIVRRAQRGTLVVGEALTGKGESEVEQLSGEFWLLVKAVDRLASEQRDDISLQREMFQTAQWAQSSEAAASLAQMAARGAKGDAKLAAIVRERQDLISEWQQRDQLYSAAVAQAPEKRNRQAEAENGARLAAIDSRIAVVDKALAANFPDYAALASPTPLSVDDVQAQLRPDEALLLFLVTPPWKPAVEATFIWVVTKTDVRWVRSDFGTPALMREVAALRCGLDYEGAWTDSHCSDLLKVSYSDSDHGSGRSLPFDAARAHVLYRVLFSRIEDLIKDKRLLIVPSGPLTQLPFQVLVTERPKAALPSSASDYRDVAWLARKHAMTVLPAVSSLKALRELARESRASEPYIGVGDPLLDGDPAKFRDDAAAAKLAREKRCDLTLGQRVVSLFGLRGGSRTVSRSSGGSIDLADLRTLPPLPETADELCGVAHDLGVDPATHVYLGAAATETKIKELSEGGALAKNKIVHFATHGAVAGEISSAAEPGLLLTPPDKASEVDDGYLSASEIAGLKLDADWVILSACNTAAGGAQGAEALSGLARAFFYAGARSLLVSHWEIASASTVKLITKAVAELKANPKIGRAEALRRSMLALMMEGETYEAHPAFWAPFVLVGEGGAHASSP